ELRLLAVVKALDISKILQSAYRTIANFSQSLPHEWAVSKVKKQLMYNIASQIKTALFDLLTNLLNNSTKIIDEEIHFNDQNIVKSVIKSVEKGIYRSIKDILAYLILTLVQNKILNLESKNIYLQISSDGRNVKHKVKHVMFIFSILNNLLNIHKPNYHYMLVLYPKVKKYESLETVLALLILDLEDIKMDLLINKNDYRKFICIFQQIGRCLHFVLDTRQLMLIIFAYSATVRKMRIVILKKTKKSLKATKKFDSKYFEIIEKMKRINIYFEFWQEKETTSWKYTSLIESNKLKVLYNFNLARILPNDYAILVCNL
ncbi:11828_t:CDS:2, partial [Racocetra fulgida]